MQDDDDTPQKRSSFKNVKIKSYTFGELAHAQTMRYEARTAQMHQEIDSPIVEYMGGDKIRSEPQVKEEIGRDYRQDSSASIVEADESPPPAPGKRGSPEKFGGDTPYDGKVILNASQRSSNMSYQQLGVGMPLN